MLPSQIMSGLEPPEELAKAKSFNYKAWVRQGRALPDVEETICRFLENNGKWIDRRKATDALWYVGTAQSVPVLIECLDDEDGVVQTNAIAALHTIGVANDDVFRALARLCDYAKHRDTRLHASNVLAKLFGKRAVGVLESCQEKLKWELECNEKILRDLESSKETSPSPIETETTSKKAEEGK